MRCAGPMLSATVGWNGAEFDRWTLGLMRRTRVPGLSFGVVRRGRRVLARGYGWRDRTLRLPASARTVYGIASMTKSFTALALLRLQELGALRVSDPVTRHLPEFRTSAPRYTRRITLHHFLTHSSGLPPLPSIYYTSGRSIARDPPYDPKVARRVGIDPEHPPIDTYEGLMEYLASARYRMLGPPGRYFSYSNEGFGLLGAVVERSSGRTVESFLEEEIFRPAGMRSTTFDTGIMFRLPEVTTLYSPNWRRGKGPLVASQEWWEDTCLRAAGAIRSTVEDLLAYLEIYLRNGRAGRERIVAPESLAAMLRPQIEVRPGLYYGYGIAVRPEYHGRLLAYHGGGLKGVSSMFAVVPALGVGGVVLSNADQAPSALVLQAGINQLLGLPKETPFVDTPPPGPRPPSLGEYGGWYCSGEGIWVEVTPRRDYLRLDARGIEHTERGLRLRPHGDDGFVTRQAGQPAWYRFLRDRNGHVFALHFGWRVVRKRNPRTLSRAREGRMVW
jgi:CubicO group peptidase (beta-lactamase class C family)